MPLTLSQFLFLVLTLAIVVFVTVFIILSLQLRRTAKEAEETLTEARALVNELKEVTQKASARIDDFGGILESAKKTTGSVSELAWFLSTKVVKPSSKYWPFLIPLLRMGWRQWKKKKEEKHGE